MDYNYVVIDANEKKETQLYYLNEDTMKNVPNSRMERLMLVLSSTPHEALLSLHANLQGIVFYIIFDYKYEIWEPKMYYI